MFCLVNVTLLVNQPPFLYSRPVIGGKFRALNEAKKTIIINNVISDVIVIIIWYKSGSHERLKMSKDLLISPSTEQNTVKHPRKIEEFQQA